MGLINDSSSLLKFEIDIVNWINCKLYMAHDSRDSMTLWPYDCTCHHSGIAHLSYVQNRPVGVVSACASISSGCVWGQQICAHRIAERAPTKSQGSGWDCCLSWWGHRVNSQASDLQRLYSLHEKTDGKKSALDSDTVIVQSRSIECFKSQHLEKHVVISHLRFKIHSILFYYSFHSILNSKF